MMSNMLKYLRFDTTQCPPLREPCRLYGMSLVVIMIICWALGTNVEGKIACDDAKLWS
jgi:hypothetical protein